ncbi:LEM domain-containing protein 2 [Eublepharis macularius]|uniref:LEM domain-containing protein 2 n=1 Tax=Eublepharis macularius TaxID=481883 RepID=A0AA97JEH6_EUBMA|nr:LEM domain-containing protein 2 [Eublepharis macularius]
MAAVGLSDAELRAELLALGYQPGPITDSTRKLYAKKLTRLRAEVAAGLRSRGSRSPLQGSSSPARPKPAASGSPKVTPRARVLVRRESEEDEDEEEEGGGSYQLSRRDAAPASKALSQRTHWGIDSGVASGRSPLTAGAGIVPSSSWAGSGGLTPTRTRLETGGGWACSYPRDTPDRLTSSSQYGTASTGGGVGLSSSKWWEREQGTTSSAPWESIRGGSSIGFSNRTHLETERKITPNSYLRSGREGLSYRTPATTTEKEVALSSRSSKAQWSTGGELSPSAGRDGTCQGVSLRPKIQGTGRKDRGLEFYLSWFLWLATLGLLIIFLGILWVKMMGPARLQGAEEDMKLLSMDCSERTNNYCQAKQEEIVMNILYELYNYLAIQAGKFECGNAENLESKCIQVREARDYIENVTGSSAEEFRGALQWLLDNHKDSGIWLQGDDPSEEVITVDQVVCLESTRPRMSLGCRFHRALSTAITNLFIFFWSLAFLWGILILLKYYWRKREEEERAMYKMVQKIIGAVQSHYKEWEQNLERYPYVGILHIRDTLIPPQDRKIMKRIWDQAVDFIASNESRIQTESHRVAGEDMLVWRWTQPSYLSDSER